MRTRRVTATHWTVVDQQNEDANTIVIISGMIVTTDYNNEWEWKTQKEQHRQHVSGGQSDAEEAREHASDNNLGMKKKEKTKEESLVPFSTQQVLDGNVSCVNTYTSYWQNNILSRVNLYLFQDANAV